MYWNNDCFDSLLLFIKLIDLLTPLCTHSPAQIKTECQNWHGTSFFVEVVLETSPIKLNIDLKNK